MYTFTTSVRVRYAETDQMGCVYYGHYALYYEVARTECLRQLGMTYKSLEETGIMLPVVESSFRYLKPALYDEVLQITTTIREMPCVRIRFNYEIANCQKEIINHGHTTLVFVNKKTGKPCRLPVALDQILQQHFI